MKGRYGGFRLRYDRALEGFLSTDLSARFRSDSTPSRRYLPRRAAALR